MLIMLSIHLFMCRIELNLTHTHFLLLCHPDRSGGISLGVHQTGSFGGVYAESISVLKMTFKKCGSGCMLARYLLL
jgi:hypothetical protein